MSFTWQTDQPEEMATIRMGCGWVRDVEGLGYTAIDDQQQQQYLPLPATVQRAMAIDDARARREEQQRAAIAEDAALEREFRLRAQGYEPHTHLEFLQGVFARQDRADRREAQRVERGLADGSLEVAPRQVDQGLRSERFTMQRQQRERAEARAVRQVQGSELDELRQEVTHLRSLLAAQGVDVVPGAFSRSQRAIPPDDPGERAPRIRGGGYITATG